MRPQDGQLYVGGLQGRETNAARDGCLQRSAIPAAPCDLPVELHFVEGGVLLAFLPAARPLDGRRSEQSTTSQQWNYHWSGGYRSPDFKVSQPKAEGHDELEVESVTLQPDGRTVFLAIRQLQPVMQIAIRYVAAFGRRRRPIESAVYGTIHALGARPGDLHVAAAAHRRRASSMPSKRPRLAAGAESAVLGQGASTAIGQS